MGRSLERKAFDRNRGAAEGVRVGNPGALAPQGDAALEAVTVNSSLYAVEAYRRLGFVETEPRRTVNGIPFVPMRRDLAVGAQMPRPA